MQPALGPGLSLVATAVAVVSALVGVVLVVVGAAVVRRSLVVARRRRALAEAGARVRGVVVGTQTQSRGSGDRARTTFRPVVSFRTASGHEVRTVAGPTTTASWVEQTSVQLRYDPDDAEHAEVLEPLAGSRVPESGPLVVVVGAVLVVAGLAGAAFSLVGLLA